MREAFGRTTIAHIWVVVQNIFPQYVLVNVCYQVFSSRLEGGGPSYMFKKEKPILFVKRLKHQNLSIRISSQRDTFIHHSRALTCHSIGSRGRGTHRSVCGGANAAGDMFGSRSLCCLLPTSVAGGGYRANPIGPIGVRAKPAF